MPNIYHLYIDDSGTRHPDRKQGRIPAHNHDYFALGGFLIHENDEDKARDLHRKFCLDWNILTPLHSTEIRARSDNFSFIGRLTESDQNNFYEELYCLMRDCPVIGIACVIDRPGYNKRYLEKYGRQRWSLCKTAFSVCVERAAKYVERKDAKLRIFAERSDRDSDTKLKEYYDELSSKGMPFDSFKSEKYDPMTQIDLKKTLYDFKLKRKTSPMAQLADLYLWPMCLGGYDPNNRPYKRLKADEKLIDCLISEDQRKHLGIKYSCWENVEKTKAR